MNNRRFTATRPCPDIRGQDQNNQVHTTCTTYVVMDYYWVAYTFKDKIQSIAYALMTRSMNVKPIQTKERVSRWLSETSAIRR